MQVDMFVNGMIYCSFCGFFHSYVLFCLMTRQWVVIWCQECIVGLPMLSKT